MTQTLSLRGDTKNQAAIEAEGNFAANRAAIGETQAEILSLLEACGEEVEFLFARDGSLTAMHPGGRWWGNCSLPRRAAQFMFKSLEIRGVLGCFLFPVHAAQMRAALDRLEEQQGIVALIPDGQTLRIMLRCEDFSRDIRSHRLWFAGGEEWEAVLARLFVENPGLPTPADFVRAISVDQSAADGLIGPAQKIFAEETARRSVEINSVVTSHPRENSKTTLCVVAPSRFRLWNDAPVALGGVLSEAREFEIRSFDSDDPASASPLALGRSAAGSDAVVTANLGRADLPPVVRSETPVITWVTMPRIPAYESTASRDALVVADPRWVERAQGAGWPEGRVFVGTWPVIRVAGNGSASPALIADTLRLVPPKSVNEFSSHLLLWDLIASELRHDPSVLGDDIDAYLAARLKRLQIDEGAFNKALFIECLILPAYQQLIARALLGKNIAVRLFGKGWNEIDEFAQYAAGAVKSRQHFQEILGESSALVHAWPTANVHPVEFTTLPVIRPRHLAEHPDLSEIPAISGEIVRAALQ